jgi:ABC-type branched-subunit amino acid transport system ATPase component
MGKTFTKLEDSLDLPALDVMETEIDPIPNEEDVLAALTMAENLETKFKKVDGFEQHDQEMDELAQMAIQSHKDLQELGMEVEIKYAGEIFNSSTQMLNIAVTAKNLKVEKKLKLLKLQLDKMRVDRMTKSDDSAVVEGTSSILDRNQLLQMIKDSTDNDK